MAKGCGNKINERRNIMNTYVIKSEVYIEAENRDDAWEKAYDMDLEAELYNNCVLDEEDE